VQNLLVRQAELQDLLVRHVLDAVRLRMQPLRGIEQFLLLVLVGRMRTLRPLVRRRREASHRVLLLLLPHSAALLLDPGGGGLGERSVEVEVRGT
jgi:hypothetical protein